MLEAGSIVHYGMDGVCEITGITEKKLGGQVRRFYELHPRFRKNTVVFLPVDNESLLSRIRPVLSRDEILSVLHELKSAETCWIDSEAARKETYSLIIRSGDHRRLVSLVKTLYERKLQMQEDGRRLRSVDSAFLKDAERLVNEEFAFVLEIEPSEAAAFIQKELS